MVGWSGAQALNFCSSRLWVPITPSTSCDQAIFVDQATGASMYSDAVPVEIRRRGSVAPWPGRGETSANTEIRFERPFFTRCPELGAGGAGVPATDVARRAEHGVAVLLKIYAHCIDGQADAANQRITDALSTPQADQDPGDEGDADSEPAA
jgi:hypothetical protein